MFDFFKRRKADAPLPPAETAPEAAPAEAGETRPPDPGLAQPPLAPDALHEQPEDAAPTAEPFRDATTLPEADPAAAPAKRSWADRLLGGFVTPDAPPQPVVAEAALAPVVEEEV